VALTASRQRGNAYKEKLRLMRDQFSFVFNNLRGIAAIASIFSRGSFAGFNQHQKPQDAPQKVQQKFRFP
jgi:hypothetical protein